MKFFRFQYVKTLPTTFNMAFLKICFESWQCSFINIYYYLIKQKKEPCNTFMQLGATCNMKKKLTSSFFLCACLYVLYYCKCCCCCCVPCHHWYSCNTFLCILEGTIEQALAVTSTYSCCTI